MQWCFKILTNIDLAFFPVFKTNQKKGPLSKVLGVRLFSGRDKMEICYLGNLILGCLLSVGLWGTWVTLSPSFLQFAPLIQHSMQSWFTGSIQISVCGQNLLGTYCPLPVAILYPNPVICKEQGYLVPGFGCNSQSFSECHRQISMLSPWEKENIIAHVGNS